MANQSFTDKEQQVIALVSTAFPGHQVQAMVTEVYELDGGTKETLRFVMDDAYSADFAREGIQAGESVEALASTIQLDLKSQLPMPLSP